MEVFIEENILSFEDAFIIEEKSDILMSLDAKWTAEIESKRKTYEFRKYLINKNFKRIWFYINKPVSQLAYVAEIAPAVSFADGGRIEEDGIVNSDI